MHALRAHFLQHADAVFAGQTQVKNHERKRGCSECNQGGVAVLHPVNGIAFGLKPVDNAFSDHFVVFNEKNSHDDFLTHKRAAATVLTRDTRRTGTRAAADSLPQSVLDIGKDYVF